MINFLTQPKKYLKEYKNAKKAPTLIEGYDRQKILIFIDGQGPRHIQLFKHFLKIKNYFNNNKYVFGS